MLKRTVTEAVHEVGHLLELGHCSGHSCVVYCSNQLRDSDPRGREFCARGSGIGLATVVDIVERHVGRLEVDSELGRGPAFTMYLPRAGREGTKALARSLSRDGDRVSWIASEEPSVRRRGGMEAT